MRKIIIIIFGFVLLASCGKKENEFVDEKTNLTENQKNEPDNDDVKLKQEIKDTAGAKNNTYELPKPEKTISPLEAKDFIGRVVTVKGFVAEVTKREKVAYLNFVEKFPENPFTAVIFSNKFDEFNNLAVYKNKQLEVTGRITTYKGKPQVILESKSQIRIID